MSEFHPFAALIKAQFDEMSKGELFVTQIGGDDLYDLYLASFPPGTNEIFRERTEHDCSCCKNFIRNIGNVVSILPGGGVATVWDVLGADHPYATVAAALADAVKAMPVAGIFRTSEPTYGAESTKELRDGGQVHTWHHFSAKIAPQHFVSKSHATSAGARIGEYSTTAGVFKRGLDELNAEAFASVLDLIDSNSIYRGAEHRAAVTGFAETQAAYKALPDNGARNLFVWANAGQPVARFRNTVIGSLIQDLSDGVDIEQAVKSFEKKVAPENYKRTTALITPAMVSQAMATIKELDLEPALERRFARLSDVSVNNVLWVNGAAQSKMKDGIEGLLMGAVAAPTVKADKAEDIGIDLFMATILPHATELELVVKNNQQGNFMSLTAPVHGGVEQLFKWSNNFGWSYDGNITDSIKDRVKAAGGSVEGDLCCRLAWEYRDDLDFHMQEPGGHSIYFGNRRQLSPNGGMLDLDANGADGQRDDPAENIFYRDRKTMREGSYRLQVNNYNRRSDGAGFEVEIEFDGQALRITYPKALRSGETVNVAEIIYSKAEGFRILNSLDAQLGVAKGVEKWGVQTEAPIKVNAVMFSPNYWDDNASGNKHWFFLLDGCVNPLPTRGIYNEFLKSGLERHRKVFEVLGDKTKCAPTDDQLSGVGFSSTKGESLIVNVIGAKMRKTYNVKF